MARVRISYRKSTMSTSSGYAPDSPRSGKLPKTLRVIGEAPKKKADGGGSERENK